MSLLAPDSRGAEAGVAGEHQAGPGAEQAGPPHHRAEDDTPGSAPPPSADPGAGGWWRHRPY